MGDVKYNLKEPNSKKETLVHLVFRYNNQRFKYSTGEKINPKFWNTEKQRAKESRQFPTYPEFNAWLDQLESLVRSSYRKFISENKQIPTPDELRSLIDVQTGKIVLEERLDLLGFIDHYIEQSKITKSPRTISWHKNTLERLKEYEGMKKRKVDFETIDMDFYHGFSKYLSVDLGYAVNTVAKHIQNIKAFMNEATERGLNTNMTFKNKKFKKITEPSESIYLNKNELEALYKLDLSDNPRLDKVRDLFLVGCWTGLRFSDFSSIKPSNISKMTDEDGVVTEVLDIRTKKTGEQVVIPLFPVVKSVMEKYKGIEANSLPPAISNVKMNLYLKELCSEVTQLSKEVELVKTIGHIRKPQKFFKYELVTTHTARRSFATNLYLDGFPPDFIMGITGHRSSQSFYKYIKATPRDKAMLLNKHWAKLNQTNQK